METNQEQCTGQVNNGSCVHKCNSNIGQHLFLSPCIIHCCIQTPGSKLDCFFLSLFCTEAAENHFCLDRHLSFVFLSLSCALSLLFKLAPFAIRHVLALASCPISFYIWRTILDPRNGRYKSRMLHWPSVVKPFRNENRSSSRFDSGTNLKIRYWDFIFRGRTKLLLRTMIETVQIASL